MRSGHPVIRGFFAQPSPYAGGSAVLHVATDAPAFRVKLYRCGAATVPAGRTRVLPGRDAPVHLPYQDFTRPGIDLAGGWLAPWPAYRLRLPAHWAGVYVAVLVEVDGQGRDRTRPPVDTPDGRQARALLVVRPRRPTARILYKLPLLTYHAYDVVDGAPYDPVTGRGSWCLYDRPADLLPPGTPDTVSLHRPGGGTGGHPWDAFNLDPFDPTPRQTFAHWDAPFLAWLQRAGYPVDVCTDVDLHLLGRRLLAPYRLLVSAGHDEYWTDAMRAAVTGHVTAGAAAAFFSGNTCWWRVELDGHAFRRVAPWSDGPYEPENTLIGVSFRHGGERDNDEHPVPVGFRVQHADHWVYAGTGLTDGDVFGGRREEYLVGYECDGAHFDRAAGPPVTPSGRDGTPPGFTILGVGDTRPSGWGNGNGAATMGVLRLGAGTVFNAATTDWSRVLAAGRSPEVERIARNVLDRLGRGRPAR